MTETATMRQTAPFPTALAEIVQQTTYRPGWGVGLYDTERDPADTHGAAAGGLTLIITTKGFDSYHPERGENYRVNHYFIVPAATYAPEAWLRWLFDCYAQVELHEAMEFFTVNSAKPFAPNHGPGQNPYVVHEPTTDLARRTSFRGVVQDA